MQPLVGVPIVPSGCLTSLSTGIIDTVYASPMGVFAFNGKLKIKYLVDYPRHILSAHFLKTKSSGIKFQQIQNPDKDYRTIVRNIIKKHVDTANQRTVQENLMLLKAMKDQVIEFLNFPKDFIIEGRKIRQEVIDNLGGKLFSKDAVKYYNRVGVFPSSNNCRWEAIAKIAADIEAEKKAAEEKAKKGNKTITLQPWNLYGL